ncbi:hypothetical protein B0J17DRAFT_683042 [Rhizoctonia solani]|nr:hypothetical protein B0J17DRAFT_683042 [Rhizoctonia solani]
MDAHDLQTAAVVDYEINTQIAAFELRASSSSGVPPIHNLPSEVLAQIFNLLSESYSRDCLVDGDGTSDQGDPSIVYLMPPDVLSQVCSRWRNIALGLQLLWAHIDIVLSDMWGANLLSRAELFATRVGVAQPYIHIITLRQQKTFQIDTWIKSETCIQSRLDKFTSFIAPRMQCFRFDNRSHDENLTWITRHFLPEAKPGILQELTLSNYSINNTFLVARDNMTVEERMDSNVPVQFLDELLRPIKVLRLYNVWFSPASYAYTGLVELRLIANVPCDPYNPISFYTRVLLSCPNLRIFHCCVLISPQPPPSPIHPVPLEELEVLNLEGMFPVHADNLLAHISPGPKPLNLHLLVEKVSHFPLFSVPALSFFGRSQVTKLVIDVFDWSFDFGEPGQYVSLGTLLSKLPVNLSTLDLRHLPISHWGEYPASWPTNLSAVSMHSCKTDIATLRELTRVCPIQELTLSNLIIEPHQVDQNALEEEVAKLAPVVKYTPFAPQGSEDDASRDEENDNEEGEYEESEEQSEEEEWD